MQTIILENKYIYSCNKIMKNNTHLRFYCLLIFTYEKRCHFKNKGYKEILASSQKKTAGFSGHIMRKAGLDKLTLTRQIKDK